MAMGVYQSGQQSFTFSVSKGCIGVLAGKARIAGCQYTAMPHSQCTKLK